MYTHTHKHTNTNTQTQQKDGESMNLDELTKRFTELEAERKSIDEQLRAEPDAPALHIRKRKVLLEQGAIITKLKAA